MKTRGFSILEFLIAISIGIMILLVVTFFAKQTISFNASAQASLSAQLESRKILHQIISELRSSSPSAVGAYPIETAATNTVVFFADVNSDDNADRLRFYLDTPTRSVKRGIVVAAGSPPSYNLGAETITTLINDVSNGTSTPLFDYFDSSFAGTTSPLTLPINISQVRMIRVTVKIDKDVNRTPTTTVFTSSAVLRNLKDNL